MENEPEKPKSTVPPPPDLPPPSTATPPPPSGMRMPDLAPPPPPVAPPPAMEDKAPAPPKPAPKEYDADDEVPEAGSEAAFDTRVIAAIIDSFLMGLVYAIGAILWAPVGFLVSLAYMLTKDSLPFLEGQSLGKKLMKIRAVTADGKPLTGDWKTGIIRNIFLMISPVEAYILYKKKENGEPLIRLGDEWAKTKVVVSSQPTGI